MGYSHDFTGLTEKIHPLAPVQWRQFANTLVAHWQAAGDRGATGQYVSANPRISIFFDDMSSISAITDLGTRRLARAIFVPAGMELRTCFSRELSFAHLDIHIDHAWALRLLSGALRRPAALNILGRPFERHDAAELEPLAGLLLGEVRGPSRHPLFAENLVSCLLSGLLDLEDAEQAPEDARLTSAQMRKVRLRFDAAHGRRLSTAQMAGAVNLSESWFSLVFRNTTGLSPYQWQLTRRIEQAQQLLADTDLTVANIADRLGFSDQAHLTKVFSRRVGATPASWRRDRQSP
ncbi:AraC family transcriptional regulator [Mesobaculum littorinae]|uniref:AraC family transcriptional regulator n=1 Tax=Mesobaculum littorinae TaxID=2486419 RepID=A0A438AJP1_9RHOB|nr:AraC family transcriptional regulator [Mesobaculum littorinae]RVV98827.1 AraC family transcriptional regulator [Mesobaculum littorinae]